MKKIILKSAYLFAFMLGLTGCYTVAWNPGDNNFPTKGNFLQLGDSLYTQNDYTFYDNTPWWWEIDPPTYDNLADNNNEDLSPVNITIIDFGPGIPINPPPVGSPVIVRPPIYVPTPMKPDENKDKSQDIRPRDNSNNNSSKARNDNGSRNNDNGRKR
jgi:hypothetical protein